MKKNLLILIALFIYVVGFSQTFTDNFITYQVISATPPYTVQITGYDFTNGSSSVTIPATVSNNSITYTVTVIGDQAFLGNTTTGAQITNVTIPNSVTFIGYRAFQSNLLTSVTIPDSVSQLGNLSFGENPQLASVTLSANLTDIAPFSFVSCALTTINIPSSVTAIGSNAFSNNQLTSVTIPSNVNSIATRAFFGNPLTCVISQNSTPPSIDTPTGPNVSSDSFGNRSNINLTIPSNTASAYASATWTGFNSVAEGLTGFFIVDHITYTILSSNTVRTGGYNTAGGSDVVIPATVTRGCITYDVTEVGFFFQKNLTSVTIPSSVTVILPNAFSNNPNLASAPLHNGITSIGAYAFNNCGLTSVNIPTSIITIEDASFSINDITSVTIPDNVTSLGTSAFQNNNITTLVLSNNLTSIGDFAFENNDITSINFPNTLTSIGQSVFMNNDLTSVTIPNGVTDIPQSAFLQNNLTSITLPNGITSIGTAAFRSNQLTTVTIPENVTTIGERAFNNNPLTDVTSLANTPPTITTTADFMDTFATNRGTIDLHIPTGTTGVYVTNSGALWTNFNMVTEDANLSASDFELEHGIKVITNSDELRIVSSGNVTLKNLSVFDIMGKEVKAQNDSSILEISDLPDGIYILKAIFGEGKLVKKFAK
ncbi:leucine-rich repeat domain-containing protein [Hyunsoonleella sp. SJ7]|uniref:Leucine-rich repeat domain-containing protein n=1 Tax=Hyunsoonleella aquatilis TaxID=2762758 RepID=A0A923HFG4_9FLAO|nr:leucine-rich repeat domain-containing protein [Hyunsoonleella aquatilis]MBC3759298.1 leucine-rich repeat domain-containing protein [Hyunsoonleella aquatilis]